MPLEVLTQPDVGKSVKKLDKLLMDWFYYRQLFYIGKIVDSKRHS